MVLLSLSLVLFVLLLIAAVDGCYGMTMLMMMMARAGGSTSLWQTMEWHGSTRQDAVWTTIFGDNGDRGEYMDGYTEQSMAERCRDDYKWQNYAGGQRVAMMSHLYDNNDLWEHVSMVAFAEHYVLGTENITPFDTFSKHKESRPSDEPIFSGVVWDDWRQAEGNGIQTLEDFRRKGIDYVRIECNFGNAQEISGFASLANDCRFTGLAQVSKQCQDHEMVPLLLLQVPWREPENDSIRYFEQALKSLAIALKEAGVESERVILETRPPISVSSEEERGLSGTERTHLGLATGRKMFEIIKEVFEGNKIAGFCIAGGSTKGSVPTAMEDDTQNAVRQGMRHSARQQWGFDLCFWEMGAKLMLQPEVGRLWGRNTQAGRDAARDLFRLNAQNLAEEIKSPLDV